MWSANSVALLMGKSPIDALEDQSAELFFQPVRETGCMACIPFVKYAELRRAAVRSAP
jgi:hypothetical protein